MAESVTTGAEALDGADRVSAPPWWFGTVGYEIYIRSFADSNGDGIGDLTGIAERLEHVAWLGADSIWITPFYPSPGFDHGYDVSDYTDIAAMHGSIADFEKLVARARELDLRVIVDLVPNHTSSQHPWFIDAISSPDSPHRDFYHWADPAADGGPPNNWVSHFGGPAWSLDEASGQYYCHLFLAEQPDLNWENEAVADAFDDILRFWLDRGADGFRIDVAHGLAKHPDYPDNPRIRPITDDMGPTAVFESYEHRYDLHLAATVEIYERWHDVVAPYGAALIGEVNNWVPEQMARYTVDGALDTAFFLRPGWTGWDPVELVATHREMHEAVPDRMSWVLNNHDQARSVSRYGGGSMGLDRSLALSTLEFALGGVPFLYQGEELGLENAEVAPGDLEDPIWTRNQSTETGRDASRSAMPWDTGPANGFTTGTPWLRAADRAGEETAAHQRATPGSPVTRYRELIGVRKAHAAFYTEPAQWVDGPTDSSAIVRRGDITVVANLGPEPVVVDIDDDPDVAFTSSPRGVAIDSRRLTIAGETSAILVATG